MIALFHILVFKLCGDLGHGDHRIAMSFAVASLRAAGDITVNDCANVATSFPGFVELAQGTGINISAEGAE